MTPDQRARNSAQKWLKISINEMLRISKKMEHDMPSYDAEAFNDEDRRKAEKIITELRQQAKRCAYHGLGVAVQDLLPLSKEEEKLGKYPL